MHVERRNVRSQELSCLNLTVSESGWAQLDTHWHSNNTRSPYSRIYLVESGEGILETDQERIVMQPGYAYLVPAGLMFRFSCPSVLNKLYFHINILLPDHYDLLQELSQIGQLPICADRLETMIALYQGNSLADATALQAQLLTLVSEFQAKYKLSQTSLKTYSPLVSNTICTIQEKLSAALLVDALAQQQYISRRSLSAAFRREVGVSVSRYIDDQLMMRAQYLLSQTQESIGDISCTLGFSDQFYFSRWFKKLTGISPGIYRKENKDRLSP